jgi:hypothetical protein
MPDASLVEVVVLARGTSATADTAAGATVVPVEDTTQFDEDGGVLDIVGAQYDYLSVDEDASTITLATALTADVDAYDPVSVVAGGIVAQEFLAVVDLGGGDTSSVAIPYAMRVQFPVGLYDPPVPVTIDPALTTLEDAPGRPPVLDGSYIDPTTLPDPVPVEAPSTSPAITAYGMPSSVVLKAEGIAQTTEIEYHVSTATFTPVAGDPTTLVGTATRSQVQVVTELPDGTLLQLDTDYYFHAIATNAVGAAPPSAEVISRLDPTAIETVVAAMIIAGFILAGTIQVGQILITPGVGVPGDTDYDPGGINIPLSNGGQILLPADGSAAQFTKVLLEATSLLVDDNLELRGANNSLIGTFTIQAGVQTPKLGPTISGSWTDGATSPLATSDSGLGLQDDGTNWVSVRTDGTAIDGYDKTTGAKSVLFSDPALLILSLARIGTDWYALGLIGSTTVVRKYNASWVYYAGSQFTVPTVTGAASALVIAASGSTLYVGYEQDADLKLKVLSMTTTGGSPTTVFTSADVPNMINPALSVGAADFGGAALRYVLNTGSTTKIYSATGVRQTTLEWANPNGEQQAGAYYDGTTWWVLSAAGKVWKLSPVVSSTARSVRYSKYDNDATGGTHETAWSPAVTFTHLPRQWMRITTPAPEDSGGTDDPNAIRHYIQNAGAGSYYRQADVTASPWLAYYGVPSTAGATAVSTPDFSTVSKPGVIQSAAGGVTLKGDDTWQLTGTNLTEASFTPGWINQPTGTAFSIGNGTISGDKRRVGDYLTADIVIVRGSTTSVGTGAYLFTVGETFADFRTIRGTGMIIPASGGQFPVVVEGVSSTQFALVLTSSNARVANTGAPVTWASGDILEFQACGRVV